MNLTTLTNLLSQVVFTDLKIKKKKFAARCRQRRKCVAGITVVYQGLRSRHVGNVEVTQEVGAGDLISIQIQCGVRHLTHISASYSHTMWL